MNSDIFALLSDKAALIFVGAVGGFVRWVTLREHWGDGLISIIVGGIMAGVFADRFDSVLFAATKTALGAIEWLIGPVEMASDDFTGPSGFLIGIGGIAIAGLVIDLWRAFRHKAGNGGGNGK